MRVLVDGRILGSRITGVERYISELLAKLATESVRGRNAVDVYLTGTGDFEAEGVGHIVEDATVAAVRSYDVYHRPFQPSGFSSVVELGAAKSSVLSIHDLIVYRHEEYWVDKNAFRSYRQTLEFAAVAADRIMTTSQSTKREILRTLDVDEAKVDVAYHGVSDRFHVLSDTAATDRVLARHGLKRGYIFSVGTDYPHKNRISLLRAFEQMVEDDPHLRLVMAGPRVFTSEQPEVHRLVRKLGQNVVVLENLPDEDLVALYNGAGLYVFPSLDEGFGLPVLEAFACDLPVVCSNSASLPEAAGDAALLVDARNVVELRDAMYAVLENEKLRRGLIEMGRARAREFTWERSAIETWKCYERVAGQARSTQTRPSPSRRLKLRTATAPKTFSIVICTRNRSRRLKHTLESIAHLKLEAPLSVEVVVVDNGSEDDTARVVENSRKSIGLPLTIVSEPATGVAHARNRGIRASSGEVIIFIDDDVEISPDFVAEYASAYRRWPQAACIGGKVELKWVAPRPDWLSDTLIGLLGVTLCPDEEREYRSPAYHVIGCNMSFRRDVFNEVGVFDTRLGYSGSRLLGNEEIDILRRIEDSGGTIVHSPRPWVLHLIEKDKLSKSYFRTRYFYQAVSDAQSELLRSGGSAAELVGLLNKEKEIRRSLRRDALRKAVRGKLRFEDFVWLRYVGTRLEQFEAAGGSGVVMEEKKGDETTRGLIKELSARLAESEAKVAELTGSGSRMYKLVSEYYRLRRRLAKRA